MIYRKCQEKVEDQNPENTENQMSQVKKNVVDIDLFIAPSGHGARCAWQRKATLTRIGREIES